MNEENYWIQAMRRQRSRRSVLRGAALAGAGLAGMAMLACKAAPTGTSKSSGGQSTTAPQPTSTR